MRFNSTERLGVIEAEKVITKDIQWIFREQSLIDVGIDAIIEEVKNNDPTGRLIAAQIKSGQGNFNISKNFLTLYVSNVHYSYWLGYVLPIIIIAFLPDSEILLWYPISVDTLKKTKNRWKLDIPRNSVLGKQSKSELVEILDNEFRPVTKSVPFQRDPETFNVFDLAENVHRIKDATSSTRRFINIMTEMKDAADLQTSKIKAFNVRGLSINDHEVLASMNKFASELSLFARRIINEIEIFAESFGLGFSAYWQVSTIYFSIANDESALKEYKDSLDVVLKALRPAMSSIKSMQQSINRLPKEFPKLKIAKKSLVAAIDLVLEEYRIAEEFIENMNG